MEGRAIARPNHRIETPSAFQVGRFNGGPGNCPAKPHHTAPPTPYPIKLQWRAGQLPGQTLLNRAAAVSTELLQWRAGQLPGQTYTVCVATGPRDGASMEGRAIARPNVPEPQKGSSTTSRFNGGPGNCPAKPLVRFGGSDLPVCGRLRAVL